MGMILPAATRPEDLQNPAFMGRVLKAARTTVSDGTIDDNSFAPRGGNTIIGRAAGTAGKPADIGLATNQFVANRAGTIVGTTIQETDIPSSIARDTEVTAAVSAHDSSTSSHVALATLDRFVLAAELFT